MSKALKRIRVISLITVLLITILYFLIRINKAHLEPDQVVFYVNQIKNNTVETDTIITKRIAVTLANKIFIKKYGFWTTILYKPYDIYLINDYWFIYCPISKFMLDYGPMIIINCHTGEVKFKEGYYNM